MSNHSEKKHWVFKKHTNSIQLFLEVALYLKSNKSGVSMQEKELMYQSLAQTPFYNPRDSLRHRPLDAVNHKLDGLNYYLFGYSDTLHGEHKFIFSPLGNLFLKYMNCYDERAKIFMAMLMGIQFPHPASKPSEYFSLYPFRLIFSLLLEERLDYKLYHYEVYKYLIHVDKISPKVYESIIEQLLESRKQSDAEKFSILKSQEHTIVKSVYEWEYYIAKLLATVGVIDTNSGTKFVELYHPFRENSKSATKRKATNGYFVLSDTVKNLTQALLQTYTVFDTPLALIDETRLSTEIVKEIYSFYPDELLVDIGEVTTIDDKVLTIPRLVEEYSLNPENETSGKFEEILADAFNMFINVDAILLAGAGRTDLECIYITEKEKFSVEAKSTKNKLGSINSGRLKRHRSLIGAKYTIVVTPKYVPSVKYDIEGQDIVIITSFTLSEYLYNNIKSNNTMDYKEIREIIVNNLGKDVSLAVSNLTLSKFG